MFIILISQVYTGQVLLYIIDTLKEQLLELLAISMDF